MWLWRDRLARKKNVSPYKVFNSKTMVEIAARIPPKPDSSIEASQFQINTHPIMRASLQATIAKACKDPADQWPARQIVRKMRSPSPKPSLVEVLKQVRDRQARKLNLASTVLASKETICTIALTGVKNYRQMCELGKTMRWQAELLFEPWIKAVEEYAKK
jgi:ribonuclease D